MLRSFCAFVLLVFSACGGDAAPPDSAPASAASASGASGPIEVRLVADDPTVRQRLSPAALLAYFPAELDAREPTVRSNFLHDVAGDVGMSLVRVLYRDYGDPASAVVQVEVSDLVDEPDSRDRARVEEGQDIDTYGTGEVGDLRTLDGGVGRDYAPEGGGFPQLYVLLADRFFVTFRAESPDMKPDALWELYDASGLARLAGAPVYGEAGATEVPTWAASAVAEWQETAPAAAPTPEPVAVATPLPPCDEVLPVAEVERVCRVSGIRVYPSAFSEEGAASCNRKYAVPGNLSGFDFIVSRYGDAARARAGQRVASDIENPRDLRAVSGLGDAATRYVQDSEAARTSTRVLAVASGVDLVEMKSTVLPDEPGAEVCTLDQLETLARGVAERLRR
ncbi:MAG: hypothetical protein ABJF88_14515 [Rhodothermales bacterium]